MSAEFIPYELDDLNVKFKLIKQQTTKVLGSDKLEEVEIGAFFGNFKSRGGTRSVVNGKLVIEETADIVTTWRPDIKKGCLIVRLEDNAKYEIINEPEDYSFKHIALGFSVRRISGAI